MIATLYDDFLSIMTKRINADGKCDDALICKEIAAHINNTVPFTVYYGYTLFEFIYDYGEDTDQTFMGRDEEGEKIYHTFNPTTNWHHRINEELQALGYFDRHKEWSDAQKEEVA